MSRTRRRKNAVNPWPFEEKFGWGYHDWVWHSDKYGWLKTDLVKWHSRKARRNDERRAIHKAFFNPETDILFSKEKLYRGIIWHYD